MKIIYIVLILFISGCATNNFNTARTNSDQKMFRELLEKKGVEDKDEDGWRPIHYAAKYMPEMLPEVLAKNPNINAQENDGWTALLLAVRDNKIEVVKTLLDHGADVNVSTNDGWTPLSIAAAYSLSSVKLLLEKNPDINKATNDGWSPLLLAARHNSTVVPWLLEYGANVHATTDSGWTAISLAAKHQYPAVESLLEYGADPKTKVMDKGVEKNVISLLGSVSKDSYKYKTKELLTLIEKEGSYPLAKEKQVKLEKERKEREMRRAARIRQSKRFVEEEIRKDYQLKEEFKRIGNRLAECKELRKRLKSKFSGQRCSTFNRCYEARDYVNEVCREANRIGRALKSEFAYIHRDGVQEVLEKYAKEGFVDHVAIYKDLDRITRGRPKTFEEKMQRREERRREWDRYSKRKRRNKPKTPRGSSFKLIETKQKEVKNPSDNNYYSHLPDEAPKCPIKSNINGGGSSCIQRHSYNALYEAGLDKKLCQEIKTNVGAYKSPPLSFCNNYDSNYHKRYKENKGRRYQVGDVIRSSCDCGMSSKGTIVCQIVQYYGCAWKKVYRGSKKAVGR